MREKLLAWELSSLALYQLELYIKRGRFVDQCKAEWERRTGKPYREEQKA